MAIRILIVDDHPVFRFGLRTLIGAEADLVIAGETASGAEALALVAARPVDLVLMDVNLPDLNGIEVTRTLRALHPAIVVLVISMLDDATVFKALKAGACGYVLKGTGGEETLRAIRAAAAGEAIFSPSVARRVMAFFAAPPGPTAFPELTERERTILTLVAQGLTNPAIAGRLGLSAKTVRNRVSDVFSKLQVGDRASAIAKAREAGVE